MSIPIEAPLRYVYDWSTDYRSDDNKLSKNRNSSQIRVVKISTGRLLRIRLTPGPTPDPLVCVDVLELRPPDHWHTNQIDHSDIQAVDYQLTSLGPKKTRLVLLITERWMTADHPSRAELIERVKAVWGRYAGFIESRYLSGRPASGA